MTLRRIAVLAGMVVCFIGETAVAQVPTTGNLPSFDTAPKAVMPLGPGMAPAPGMAPTPGMAPPPGAQGGFGAPPSGGPGAFGAPPPGGGQQASCMQEFGPLREAAEKRAGVLKAAVERKAERSEFCKLFKDFAAAEGKVVKFMADNQSTCHIPPQAVTQVKANHDRTVKTRDNVCNAAAVSPGGPAGPPPGPRLSDELGVRGIAGPDNATPGRGTFDTLQGNPLAR